MRRGLKYEAGVHERLQEEYGLRYVPGQWWKYHTSDGAYHYAQTDGLLYLPDRKLCVLLEVKYNHTPEAYWQCENLYVPLLSWFLKDTDYKIAAVEVVKWFDPQTPFPVRPTLCEELTAVQANRFNVHILHR